MKRLDKKFLAILLDSGDTLVDEATEIKNIRWATVRAELIPGAAEMVKGLHQRGYTLALVVYGNVDTFDNIFRQHNLSRYFAVRSISGIVGVSKPDPRIFITALEELGIQEEDYGRVMMVGNHLSRDIKGANALGLVSVWLRWSPRRSKVARDESEVPDYTIDTPLDLLKLLDRLEGVIK